MIMNPIFTNDEKEQFFNSTKSKSNAIMNSEIFL